MELATEFCHKERWGVEPHAFGIEKRRSRIAVAQLVCRNFLPIVLFVGGAKPRQFFETSIVIDSVRLAKSNSVL